MDMKERLLEAKSLIETYPDDSMRICNDILDEEGDSAHGQMALYMAGYIMMQAERFGFAYHIFKRCQELNKNNAPILSSLGMCVTSKTEAIQYFKRAIEADPGGPDYYANLAHMYLDTNQPEKCIEFCNKSLELNINQTSAIHNKAMANIMLKNWAAGWRGYQQTLGCKERRAMDYGLPDWDYKSEGEILVYGEQGVGDEIMFFSCLPDLMRAHDIVVDTDARLKDLITRSFDCPVYGTRFKDESPILKDHPDIKWQVAVGQLPYVYRSDGNFPRKPYLKTDPERRIMWRALFDSLPGKKIGIAWTGGIAKNNREQRCIDLDTLAPLIDDKNTFVCLEYDPVKTEDLERYNLKYYPKTVGKGQDIDDLAAMIQELDVVICVCTTVLHIAGALGKECHVLAPYWPPATMHSEGELPWYSSVKMHRQRKGESWNKVIRRVKECLESS